MVGIRKTTTLKKIRTLTPGGLRALSRSKKFTVRQRQVAKQELRKRRRR